MSLPGPLPYEGKHFGAERDAPASHAPRPYAERLKLAPSLVDATKVRRGALTDTLPEAAQILMILGALAPVAFAFPGARDELFASTVAATYPASAGLSYASAWLVAGWVGAVVILIAGTAGLVAARIAGSPVTQATARNRLFGAVAMVLLVLAAGAFVLAFVRVNSLQGSAGAAWVILTGAAGVYGARLAARRENWLGAVGGALALIAGGRVIFGSAALVALVLSDKVFPGQTVARHPWKRSEVAIEPMVLPPAVEAAPDDGSHLWRRQPPPQALFAATVALVFGAFAPLVLAIPGFGAGLFGDLILAIWPFSYFAVFTTLAVQASVDALLAGGAGVPGAVLVLLWLMVLPTVGGLVAARAVAARRRRLAAVGGALLLVLGGRPLFGLLALSAIAYGWALFDQPSGGAEPTKEPTHGASAE